MRFIHDNKIKARGIQKPFHAGWPFDSVNRSDDALMVFPTRRGKVLEINAEHLKFESEAPAQLVLPVLDQTRRTQNEHTPRFASCDEFADNHPRFDCFAQANLVGDEQASARHFNHVMRKQNLMR